MKSTYINPAARHQRDQAPAVYAIRNDGCMLDCDYRVRTVSFADFRESYEGWLARMTAQRLNSIQRLKKGGKHGI